jgi:hypothetical protein
MMKSRTQTGSKVSTPSLLNEHVTLAIVLASTPLSAQDYQIRWIWTANGQYSVASAYDCQFNGSFSYFPAVQIWKAKVEPKCRFFSWLVLHNRALTADNMMKKNWHCNPLCPLCYRQQETVQHILLQCNYAEALWNIFQTLYGFPSYATLISKGGPIEWVHHLISAYSKKEHKMKLGLLFMFWWTV